MQLKKPNLHVLYGIHTWCVYVGSMNDTRNRQMSTIFDEP